MRGRHRGTEGATGREEERQRKRQERREQSREDRKDKQRQQQDERKKVEQELERKIKDVARERDPEKRRKLERDLDEFSATVKPLLRDERPLVLLKRPDYIIYGDDGQPDEIFCKVCGELIARREEKNLGTQVVNGQLVQRVLMKMHYKPNYAELRLVFQGNSAHITNGCVTCLKRVKGDIQTLQQMYEADIPYAMPYEANHPRTVIRSAELSIGVGGIP